MSNRDRPDAAHGAGGVPRPPVSLLTCFRRGRTGRGCVTPRGSGNKRGLIKTIALVVWGVMLITISIWSLAPVSGDELGPDIRRWSNLGHAPAYGILAGVTYYLLSGYRRIPYGQAMLVSGFLCFALSLVLELLQPYVGRSWALSDLAMNIAGIVVVLGGCALIRTKSS